MNTEITEYQTIRAYLKALLAEEDDAEILQETEKQCIERCMTAAETALSLKAVLFTRKKAREELVALYADRDLLDALKARMKPLILGGL